jgi:hypothetical protein
VQRFSLAVKRLQPSASCVNETPLQAFITKARLTSEQQCPQQVIELDEISAPGKDMMLNSELHAMTLTQPDLMEILVLIFLLRLVFGGVLLMLSRDQASQVLVIQLTRR